MYDRAVSRAAESRRSLDRGGDCTVPIDAREVRHIASLAKLDLDDKTVEQFRHQLQAILDYVALLAEVDVSDVPPTTSPVEGGRSPREDRPAPSLSPEEALANAPDASDDHFRVPRVIQG